MGVGSWKTLLCQPILSFQKLFYDKVIIIKSYFLAIYKQTYAFPAIDFRFCDISQKACIRGVSGRGMKGSGPAGGGGQKCVVLFALTPHMSIYATSGNGTCIFAKLFIKRISSSNFYNLMSFDTSLG